MFVVLIHSLLVQPTVDPCSSERRFIALPSVCVNGAALVVKEDATAVKILQMFTPVIPQDHSPRTVYGDGNCCNRAVSLGLYGTEEHLCCCAYLLQWNSSRTRITTTRHHPGTHTPCDARVITMAYDDLVKDALIPGIFGNLVIRRCFWLRDYHQITI